MADDDKELKDQRVVTMMSPSELEAIDDWMFKNRIRSRGEAIRRLTAAGVELDNRTVALLSKIDGKMGAVNDLLEKQVKALSGNDGTRPFSREDALELALACLEAGAEYEEIASSALDETFELLTESLSRSRGKAPETSPVRGRLAGLANLVRRALGRE